MNLRKLPDIAHFFQGRSADLSVDVIVERKGIIRQHSTQVGVATHHSKRDYRLADLVSYKRSILSSGKVNSARMVNGKVISAGRMIFVVLSAKPVEHFGCIIDCSLVFSVEL